MQYCDAPTPGRGLADAVLVDEGLGHRQPPALIAEHRRIRNPDVAQRDLGVIGRHVEGPPHELDVEPRRLDRDDETADPFGVALVAGRPGEHVVVGRGVHAGVPSLGAVDDPLVAVTVGGRFHPGGVRSVHRLGQTEADPGFAGQHLRYPMLLLLGGAVQVHHQHRREVADHRALVLQVVVQPQSLGREVLADDRHPEVGPVAAAEFLRQVITQEAGCIGPPPHLPKQVLPLGVRPAVALEVGTGPLPTMVEEPDIVILALEGLDLVLDEGVELIEQGLDFLRYGKVHVAPFPVAPA